MKSQDINQRIINACRELACSRGFYHLTVDELAREAGISKRTLYRYYRSKEEIIAATLETFMDEMAHEIEDILAAESNPVVIVNLILSRLVDGGQFIINPAGLYDLQKHYPHLWQKIDRFRVERIRIAIEILNQKNSNQYAPLIDPQIITAVITASIQAVLNPGFILEHNMTFQAAAQQLSYLLIAFLREA